MSKEKESSRAKETEAVLGPAPPFVFRWIDCTNKVFNTTLLAKPSVAYPSGIVNSERLVFLYPIYTYILVLCTHRSVALHCWFPGWMKRYVCWEEEQDPSLLDPFFFFFFFLVYDEL